MSKSEKQNIKLDKVDDKTAYENLLVKYAELEKENAGLKERLELLNLNANIAVRDLNDLLTKAKEIIRTFLNMPMPNNEEVFADVGMFLTKAEQFLKEIEK